MICGEGVLLALVVFGILVHHLDTLPTDVNMELHSGSKQAQLATFTHAAMRKAACTTTCDYVTLIIGNTKSQ